MESFTSFDLNSLVQLVVAMVLGMILGVQRNFAHKTAGLRTYSLVCMGATLFIIISLAVRTELAATGYDVMRVVSGIITGVGFIGAGIIFFRETTVTGLTTSAGLWVAAGIGIAVGFELYAIAIYATALTFLAFTLLWHVKEEIEEKIGN